MLNDSSVIVSSFDNYRMYLFLSSEASCRMYNLCSPLRVFNRFISHVGSFINLKYYNYKNINDVDFFRSTGAIYYLPQTQSSQFSDLCNLS